MDLTFGISKIIFKTLYLKKCVLLGSKVSVCHILILVLAPLYFIFWVLPLAYTMVTQQNHYTTVSGQGYGLAFWSSSCPDTHNGWTWTPNLAHICPDWNWPDGAPDGEIFQNLSGLGKTLRCIFRVLHCPTTSWRKPGLAGPCVQTAVPGRSEAILSDLRTDLQAQKPQFFKSDMGPTFVLGVLLQHVQLNITLY